MNAPTVESRAFALRPVRVDTHRNIFVNYDGTTFPRNPRAGCDITVRRLAAFGFIVEDSDLILDVLDEQGDILQELFLSRDGFEYLRRTLKFKRERRMDGAA